ncbi:MAG: NYN domain-containing protein [bacterium]
MDNYYLEKLKKSIKGRVYIFIDAANLERSVQDMWVNPKDASGRFGKYYTDQLCWKIDYEKFKIFFAGICNCRKIKFYSASFNSESHIKFLSLLGNKLHFDLKTKPLKEYNDHTADSPHRKANFDVEIAVDATYELNKYDTFILFSGDCDFEYLLKFLRSQNKSVIVFSRSGHIAKELPPAANQYFDIVNIRLDILKIICKAKDPAIKAGPAVNSR